MAMTGPQLRVLTAAHARVAAAERARTMVSIRMAVWAGQEDFDAALQDGADGQGAGRSDWLEGWDGTGEDARRGEA